MPQDVAIFSNMPAEAAAAMDNGFTCGFQQFCVVGHATIYSSLSPATPPALAAASQHMLVAGKCATK